MRATLFMALLTLMYRTSTAQANLLITITNIRDVKGELMIGLFTNERDFPRTAAIGKVVAVTGDSVSVVFPHLSRASYAISVIHDANSNGELDTNVFGIPKEGFAFGNNTIGLFGPPSFKNAQITIDEHPVKQILVLKYF